VSSQVISAEETCSGWAIGTSAVGIGDELIGLTVEARASGATKR
jgi:hypothetical protein